MYKKQGKYRESNLDLILKALVTKVLEEQGLSMELRTVMEPPRELVLVGNPLEVSNSQGSTVATTPIDRI